MATLPEPQLCAAIGQVLQGFGGVGLAIVFGSRAKGGFHTASDLDLAVDVQGVDLGELRAKLSERLGVEVDLVNLSDATIPLLKQLIEHGSVVHERSAGDGALWRLRVLVQLETDGPWYDRMRCRAECCGSSGVTWSIETCFLQSSLI